MKIGQKNSSKKKQVKKPATSATFATPEKFDIDKFFPEGQYPVCFVCHKSIRQLRFLTNIDGKPVHKSCRQKILDQQKSGEKR